MFLGGSFSLGNCVGNKSSERQFSLSAISRRILSGGNYSEGNCGSFPWGQLSSGQLSGWQFFLGGNYPRGYLSVGP